MIDIVFGCVRLVSCGRPVGLHHFIGHPAKKEGISPVEVLDRVTMQLFVREYSAMIVAPVQRDVDGIPKGSHYVRVSSAIGQPNENKMSDGHRERV